MRTPTRICIAGLALSAVAAFTLTACIDDDSSQSTPLEPVLVDPTVETPPPTIEVQPHCMPNPGADNVAHDDGASCNHDDEATGQLAYCVVLPSPDEFTYCRSCSDGVSGCEPIPSLSGTITPTVPVPPIPPLPPLPPTI